MLQLGIKFAFELYGASKVTLEVFENNPSAYHCYKAVGFIENGYSVTYNICNEEWKSIEMEICNKIHDLILSTNIDNINAL